jgi:hypothetical protein
VYSANRFFYSQLIIGLLIVSTLIPIPSYRIHRKETRGLLFIYDGFPFCSSFSRRVDYLIVLLMKTFRRLLFLSLYPRELSRRCILQIRDNTSYLSYCLLLLFFEFVISRIMLIRLRVHSQLRMYRLPERGTSRRYTLQYIKSKFLLM